MATGEGPLSWAELPPMLTLSEVAALCRVSATSTYEACRRSDGWLHDIATKCGSQWRIPRDRLRAQLEAGDR